MLLGLRDSAVVDTDTGGATIEVENTTLRIAQPLREPRLSDRYVDPELVDGFGNLFTKRSRSADNEAITVADRIYAWPTIRGRGLDQFQKVVNELRANPTSRRAIIQIWNPDQDLKSGGVPSGHCYFYFSIREGRLNLTANSRSVDAWIGEPPNLLTLAKLQQDIAARLGVESGILTRFIMSYHMYLRDIPEASRAFGRA